MSSGSEHKAPVRPGYAWGQIALISLPAIVFYALLVRYFVAVPILDDYWYMIAFALKWHAATGAGAKAWMIVHTQVGPYKLILIHALLGLQLALTGRLHFPAMMWTGNLSLLGVFALLCRHTPLSASDRYRYLPLLPVSLLMFSLNYAETTDWAVMDLQEPTVILLSLAALHFLLKSGDTAAVRARSFVLACAFGLLASADYANGTLVFPVGYLFLLLQARRLGGSSEGWPWRRLLAWTGCFAATLYPYLSHYSGSGMSVHAPLGRQAIFLLSFLGGGLENMHHRPLPYLSVVLGLAVVLVILLAVKTRYYQRNPFFFSVMLWSLLTAMVVTNGRISFGLQQALSVRYKIFADLLLIFCYQYGLDRFRQRSPAESGSARSRLYLQAAIAGTFVFCVGSDLAGRTFLATRRLRAETAMRNYQAAPQSASPMFLVEDTLSPDERRLEDTCRQQLNAAIQQGLYTPPPADRLGFFQVFFQR